MLYMKWSLYIGQFRKIKVYIHWSFLVLLSFIVISQIKAGHTSTQIIWTVLYIFSIFACVVLHEFGHALVGQKFDVVTQDIILLPIGGMARMKKIPEDPKAELLIAIAGPMVNVIIAGIIIVVLVVTGKTIEVLIPTVVTKETFIKNLLYINVLLVVFNFLPAFPMDGGRVFRALMSFKFSRIKATRVAVQVGQLVAIIFIILGIYVNTWLVFIGIFVYLGAGAELGVENSKSYLHGHHVNEITMKNYTLLKENETLKSVIDKLLNGQEKEFIIVNKQQEVTGYVTMSYLLGALSKYGQNITVDKIMLKNVLVISAKENLDDVWLKMTTEKISIAAVQNEKGKIDGVLDLENISEYLMIQKSLSV